MRTITLKAGSEELMTLGHKTYIMGILNVTPDSFSDGGDHQQIDEAVAHAKQMITEGADIIDVGGESTRPGSADVSEEEELNRVIPVIKALRAAGVNCPISIDTYKANVAKQAILAGATMINDVWGFQKDPQMAVVAATYAVPAIVMHNQVDTVYNTDIMQAMRRFFDKTLEIAKQAGMDCTQIILDPGIGFGKNYEQNIEVMSRLEELNSWGYPWLLGTSRKSMIGKILDLPPKDRVEGTIATNVLGVQHHTDIIRVHDISAHVKAIRVADAIVRR